MPVAMLPLHFETTLAKEGHACKFKLRLLRFSLSDTVTNARGRLLASSRVPADLKDSVVCVCAYSHLKERIKTSTRQTNQQDHSQYWSNFSQMERAHEEKILIGRRGCLLSSRRVIQPVVIHLCKFEVL